MIFFRPKESCISSTASWGNPSVFNLLRRLALLRLTSVFYLARLKLPMRSLGCLNPGSLCQCVALGSSSALLSTSWTYAFPRPQNGSGPISGADAPFRTRVPTCSLPSTPMCPGTQRRITLLFLPRSLSFPRHYRTIIELMLDELNALMAA